MSEGWPVIMQTCVKSYETLSFARRGKSFMSMPKLGNLAPAFTLKDQNGDDISLKDFRGEKHVVLYFYPKAIAHTFLY